MIRHLEDMALTPLMVLLLKHDTFFSEERRSHGWKEEIVELNHKCCDVSCMYLISLHCSC